MDVSALVGRYEGCPVLVVAGGPSVDGCRAADFAGMPTIGVNSAFRIWPVQLSVVVNGPVYDDVWSETPANRRVVATSCNLAERDDPYLYEPREGMDVLAEDDPQGLVAGTCGGTGTAIHLAYRCGARTIFVIGADLGLRGERYHAVGYWKDTHLFRGMGWRKDLRATEQVFARQGMELTRITARLAGAGTRVYFVSPDHWRRHAGRRT